MLELHVCVVGGIYDQPPDDSPLQSFTPETVLAQGLAARGVQVTTVGHHSFVPSERYHVVHVHHLGRAALWMATATTGARFVYTAHHDPALLDPSGDRNGSRLRTRIRATQMITARADAVVALSGIERDALGRLLVSPAERTHVIPNGIPTEMFFPPAQPPILRPMRRSRLLYVGQLIELKGVDVLLRALSEIQDAELLLVYRNPALEKTFRALATDLDLADRVQFLGARSAAQLADLYRTVDLLVLPSRSEALPSVISEAMLSGLPIVASAVGGIPEQVGAHGRLVPPDDVDQLTAALRATLIDLRANRIDHAAIHADATRRFGVPTMIERHLRLYSDLLAGGEAPVRHRARYRPGNAAARLALRTVGERLTGHGLLDRDLPGQVVGAAGR
jgi:glycosyltransferase involved in cell wall biosynthesis